MPLLLGPFVRCRFSATHLVLWLIFAGFTCTEFESDNITVKRELGLLICRTELNTIYTRCAVWPLTLYSENSGVFGDVSRTFLFTK
ncbi:hypothetical protein PAMP_023525 [Pampus punctatissimus]